MRVEVVGEDYLIFLNRLTPGLSKKSSPIIGELKKVNERPLILEAKARDSCRDYLDEKVKLMFDEDCIEGARVSFPSEGITEIRLTEKDYSQLDMYGRLEVPIPKKRGRVRIFYDMIY